MGLLDALGLATAHLAGVYGGVDVAQRLARHHPSRVASLTVIVPSAGESERAEDPDAGASAESGTAPTDSNPYSTDRPDGADAAVPTLVLQHAAPALSDQAQADAPEQRSPDANLILLRKGADDGTASSAGSPLVAALLRHTSGGWPRQADRLAASAVAAGSPTAWFESLYGAAVSGEVDMPWNRSWPHPLLVRWMDNSWQGRRRGRAVVVGSGLGADAAYLADLGFDTVGFDVSPSAVAVARERHRQRTVEYVVADLFDLPPSWRRSFDLVVEIFTVQALPRLARRTAISQVPELVGPGGRLVVVAARRDDRDRDDTGPPWPLTRAEIDAFATGGVSQTHVEQVADPVQPDLSRWVAEFTRREEIG